MLSNGLNETSEEPLRNFLTNFQKNNAKLESLDLNLYANKLGYRGSLGVFEGLKGFSSLKELNLDLYRSNKNFNSFLHGILII